MGFEDNPADEDEHGLCRHEIKKLSNVIAAMSGVSLHQCNRMTTSTPLQFARHPLTCGNNSQHGNLYPVYEDDRVKLICPDCDYTQDNAAMFSVGKDTA